MVDLKVMTLMFVRRLSSGSRQILLGIKKTGFGKGKINGFGGKVEPGETIESAALRELHEECAINALSCRKRGRLVFTFDTIPTTMEVHVFETRDFDGEPQETLEMLPNWYTESEIPYEKMWADDSIWLPILLQDEHMIDGAFHFRDESTLHSHSLKLTPIL